MQLSLYVKHYETKTISSNGRQSIVLCNTKAVIVITDLSELVRQKILEFASSVMLNLKTNFMPSSSAIRAGLLGMHSLDTSSMLYHTLHQKLPSDWNLVLN